MPDAGAPRVARQVWSAWADIGVKRPWIGLCGDRIVIACAPSGQADVAHVAALVEAGIHPVPRPRLIDIAPSSVGAMLGRRRSKEAP